MGYSAQMWKWCLGPFLVGTGYVTGSVYGRDSEQLVHKSPSVTYAALEQALVNVSDSGTTFFDGGTPVPYEVELERSPDRRLVVRVLFAGRQGAQAVLDFLPEDGGKATLLVVQVHGDTQVLRMALAGTSRARLAYAPDWMLNIAARPMLEQLAEQIDRNGEAAFGAIEPADAATDWQNNLTDEQRNQMQEWQQYDATRPTLDPDADAKNATENLSGA